MERVMEQSVEEKEEVKGTSREPGALAGVYEVLSQRAIDEAIRIGVEAGTAAAERRLEEGKKEQTKGRYTRRLHNTRLLLANYRNLKEHVSGAVFNGRKAKESALDILDGLDSRQRFVQRRIRGHHCGKKDVEACQAGRAGKYNAPVRHGSEHDGRTVKVGNAEPRGILAEAVRTAEKRVRS